MKRICIIGGGAAGMMAAITAARQGGKVTILEKNDRVGKKILSTGNGKCNLGNLQMSVDAYNGGAPEQIGKYLEAFGTEETIRFFNSLGLLLKEKNGYLYPLSEQATTVLDVLRYELQSLQVEVLYGAPVLRIQKKNHGFLVTYAGGKREFDKVILTTGGKSASKTGSDGSGYRLATDLGHSIVEQVPALVQLKCREDYMKAVSGVRVEALIQAFADGELITTEQGELQLTDYGVSGIPVFQLSRKVNYALLARQKVTLQIDLLPGMGQEELEHMKLSRRLLQCDRTVEEFFTGTLNKKLVGLFLRLTGLKPGMTFEEAEPEKIEQVYQLMKNWSLEIVGHNGFENAQVSAGGVSLKEVGENMESTLVPGLYLAGEVLDVDGRCGGYNLQWAWCSGYLAGNAVVKNDSN